MQVETMRLAWRQAARRDGDAGSGRHDAPRSTAVTESSQSRSQNGSVLHFYKFDLVPIAILELVSYAGKRNGGGHEPSPK